MGRARTWRRQRRGDDVRHDPVAVADAYELADLGGGQSGGSVVHRDSASLQERIGEQLVQSDVSYPRSKSSGCRLERPRRLSSRQVYDWLQTTGFYPESYVPALLRENP